MEKQYELQTHQVEDDHWWYRGRRRVLNRVYEQLDLPPEARILDAGCGSGRNMVELAQFGQVIGIELAEASVVAARARGVGEVVHGSVDDMPFPGDDFDLAVSLDVLEHLDNDLRCLEELRRVVRPGGYLVVTVPAYPWLWSDHDAVNHHRRRYTRASLLEAATMTEWQTLRTTHFNSLLLPAAVATRALQRTNSANGAARSDLVRTPGWLNGPLQLPLNAEARAISRGARIPIGLSLLAVLV